MKTDQPAASSSPILLDAKAAAALLNIGPTHFYSLKAQGRLPEPVHLGRSVRWRRAELVAWAATGCPPRDRWSWPPAAAATAAGAGRMNASRNLGAGDRR